MTTGHSRYFKNRPSCKKLFVVDGAVFIDHVLAARHAKKVKKSVEVISMDDDYSYEDAWEILKNLDLNQNIEYKELGKLVKALELEPEGKSTDDYLKVLTDCKTQIEE